MVAVVDDRGDGWGLALYVCLISSVACGKTVAETSLGPADAQSTAVAGDSSDGSLPPLNVRLDPSFGMEGTIGGDLADWAPVGVAVDGEGRIVVSGPGSDPNSPLEEVVRRLTPDGELDVAFGTSGKVTVDANPDTWAQAVRVLPGGGIGILGGTFLDGEGAGSFAFRLNADGSPDTSFTGSPSLASATGPFAAGLWMDDGSGLSLGGSASLRFGASGAVDTAFGSGGLIAPAVAGAFVSDNRLWVAASHRVSRYLATGLADPAFGGNGSVDLPWGDCGPDAPSLQCLLLEAGDEAIVFGAHPSPPSFDVDVVRLTASGGIDSTYGMGGITSIPAEGAPVGAAQLMNGRVIVWTSYGELLALATDGVPQGTWTLGVGGTVLAATLDPGQRLVVVGMTTDDPMRSTWFVRRYLLL
jgi:uncharacterized delta-60 repeat protein